MVLVDTSVWIDYFHGGINSAHLDFLIDADEVRINDLILTELIPAIRHRKEAELENLLQQVPKEAMNIDWSQLISMQTENLKHGVNRVGIPDLMIVQNAEQNDMELYSLDKHFKLMSQFRPLKIFEG